MSPVTSPVTSSAVVLPQQVATRRWRRGALARVPHVVITLYVLMAAIGPLVIDYNPVHTPLPDRLLAPGGLAERAHGVVGGCGLGRVGQRQGTHQTGGTDGRQGLANGAGHHDVHSPRRSPRPASMPPRIFTERRMRFPFWVSGRSASSIIMGRAPSETKAPGSACAAARSGPSSSVR